MTDDTQDIVARLRNTPNWLREEFSHWKNCRTSYDRAPFEAADIIEEQAAEIERLGRELNKAKYGNPDFAWEMHQAEMDVAQAELKRLYLLLAEKALDQKKGPGDEAEAS